MPTGVEAPHQRVHTVDAVMQCVYHLEPRACMNLPIPSFQHTSSVVLRFIALIALPVMNDSRIGCVLLCCFSRNVE